MILSPKHLKLLRTHLATSILTLGDFTRLETVRENLSFHVLQDWRE